MDTLVNLSGGLDSTYVLWRHLSDHTTPPLVHHCVLKTKANGVRWERELDAVRAILAWLCDHDLGHFEYVESTVDYRGLGAHPRDNLTIELMTGTILLNPAYRSIRRTLSCVASTEVARVNRQRVDFAGYRARSLAMRRMVWHPRRRRPRDLVTVEPIRHMSKHDVWQATPPELRALTASCRYGIDCGRCHSCRQLEAVR